MSRGLDVRWLWIAVTLVVVVSGCRTTTASGRRWGEDATIAPGWRRVGAATRNALSDPRTWIPALAAGTIAALDLDDEISQEASDSTPIFGSKARARSASDTVRDVLRAEAVVTALLTPSGELDKPGWQAKGQGLAVELAAYGAARGTTDTLKRTVDRQRPLEDDDDLSFPSGHAGESFAAAALSNRNLSAMDIPRPLVTTLDVTNTLAATTVAWARVEGQKHFPTDVLAGAAMSNFIALFFHDAFLGLDDPGPWRLGAGPGNGLALEGQF